MKSKQLLIICFLLLVFCVSSGQTKDIPDWVTQQLNTEYTQISKDTDAILRYSDVKLSYAAGKITSHEKLLFQIVRVEGLMYGTLRLDLIKGSNVSDLIGFRFDSSKELVEELEKKNIKRTAYNEHFYDDCEQLTAKFQGIETGDLVAFEYEQEWEPFFKTNVWRMGGKIEVAYERIEVPKNAECTILNDPDNAIKTSGTIFTVESWSALKSESGSPPYLERMPAVGIVFDPGMDQTWEAFSKQFWRKIEDLPPFSPEVEKELQDLLKISNKEEFIRKTLRYVSQSVRYVAIEVGEGRFIPRDCNLVHTKKYGDCKDMAYYAIAILKLGGVNAYPVLARTKSIGPVLDSFPANQFNHAIAAVELDEASASLENIKINGKPYLIADLTDKYTDPPMLSSHLEKTKILPILPDSSALLDLPSAPADLSMKHYDIQINLDAQRTGEIALVETKSGHFAAYEKSFRESLDKQKESEKYRKWAQTLVPGAEMKEFSVDAEGESVQTNIRFFADYMGTDVNDLIYFGPNLIDANYKGYRQRKRETDLCILYYSVKKIDVAVTFDSAFQIVSIPGNHELDNDYFSFTLKAEQTGSTVDTKTCFTWNTHRITVDQYPDFRKKYKNYLKLAKSQIGLKLKPAIR